MCVFFLCCLFFDVFILVFVGGWGCFSALAADVMLLPGAGPSV